MSAWKTDAAITFPSRALANSMFEVLGGLDFLGKCAGALRPVQHGAERVTQKLAVDRASTLPRPRFPNQNLPGPQRYNVKQLPFALLLEVLGHHFTYF